MEVRIEHLTKVFDSKTHKGKQVKAVNDMSFVIPDGKLVGLLGPSGCGKSTTLYMIAGLHKPSEGKIWFGDDDVTNVPPENRGIGLVFQNYALYPHLTVGQNISFPLDNIKPPLEKTEKEKIIHKMAKLVDIDEFLERKPSQLSGGQQQRVAIARALAKTPRILLLDEPLSNLDARLRLQTREEIKRVQRETGITTVFVTHDQEEAMSISDFIVVMKLGIVQQIGEPQYVYDEPANLFVAKFLGSPAINVFDGQIKGGKLYVSGVCVDEGKQYQGTHEAITTERKLVEMTADEKRASKKKLFGKTENTDAPEGMKYIEVEKKETLKDRTVKIGIRPEAFVLNNEKGLFSINVDTVQHIGRDISIVGKIKDQESSNLRVIISSEERDNVCEGKTFKFDAKRFYVFEESGERIK